MTTDLKKMTKKYVIFDLDGTLIDTIPDLLFLLNGLLSQMNRPLLKKEDMKYLIGHGSHYLIEQMCKRTGAQFSEEEIKDVFNRWIKIYSDSPMDLTRPFDGVPETLQRLKDAGCKLSLCTNKPPAPTKYILDKLDLRKYFDVVLDADSLPIRKPNPEPLWEAVKRMGGDISDALMVGDSEPDLQAANAANIPVVLMSYGYAQTPYEDLKAMGVLPSFDKLADIVLAP